MSQPTSPVDVCNLALTRIGEKHISALDIPNTSIEKLCAKEYDQARRVCLSTGSWGFARKREKIQKNSYVPEFDYSSAYDLPGDYIRLLSVGSYIEWQFEQDYDIQGNQLVTVEDDDELSITYIYDHKDVAKWSPGFVKMVSLELAVAIGYTIGKKNGSVERCERQLATAISEATSTNGQNKPPVRIQESKMLNARRRASGGNFYDPSRVIFDS